MHDFLFGTPRVSIGITWDDPDWVEATSITPRLQVIARIEGEGLAFAEQQFRVLCELTGAFWGELNETAVTEKITFSGLNEHFSRLPQFGTMNYLGEDYVAFVGSRVSCESGFSKVETWKQGLFTYIFATNRAAFASQQEVVLQRLGGDEMFKEWKHDCKPKFQSRIHHVTRYGLSSPPMEFRITAKGLKKKISSPHG